MAKHNLMSVIAIAMGVSFPCICGGKSIADNFPKTYLNNGQVLMETRTKVQGGDKDLMLAYSSMSKAAHGTMPTAGTAWSMTTGPWSVMNKTLAIPGVSKHEYLSIGIYNHPCNNLPPKCKAYPNGHLLPPSQCDNSTGLPWEPCDGIINPSAIAEGDSPRNGDMSNAVITLSHASFFCVKEDPATCSAWAARAAAVLKVWFVDEETMMEPNLFYGQITPHKTAPQPSHGGFIEWAHTPQLLDAIAVLHFAHPTIFTVDDNTAVMAWFSQFHDYVISKPARGERNMANNHGTWFDSTWQAVALHTGNVGNASIAADEVLHRRIDIQIRADGKEWIELERANPSGYCEYNLLALASNANQAQNGMLSSDIWNYESVNGSSIRKAIDWLLPYATGETKWPYSQNSEQPGWVTMFTVFRFASIAFKNETYEKAACLSLKPPASSQIPSSSATPPDWATHAPWFNNFFSWNTEYTKDTINLLSPPIFKITCE